MEGHHIIGLAKPCAERAMAIAAKYVDAPLP